MKPSFFTVSLADLPDGELPTRGELVRVGVGDARWEFRVTDVVDNGDGTFRIYLDLDEDA